MRDHLQLHLSPLLSMVCQRFLLELSVCALLEHEVMRPSIFSTEAGTSRGALCTFSQSSTRLLHDFRRRLTPPPDIFALLPLSRSFISAFLLFTSLRITWAPPPDLTQSR